MFNIRHNCVSKVSLYKQDEGFVPSEGSLVNALKRRRRHPQLLRGREQSPAPHLVPAVLPSCPHFSVLQAQHWATRLHPSPLHMAKSHAVSAAPECSPALQKPVAKFPPPSPVSAILSLQVKPGHLPPQSSSSSRHSSQPPESHTHLLCLLAQPMLSPGLLPSHLLPMLPTLPFKHGQEGFSNSSSNPGCLTRREGYFQMRNKQGICTD